MSIKADKWLIRKCTIPSHRAYLGDRAAGFGWVNADFPENIVDERGEVCVGEVTYRTMTDHDHQFFKNIYPEFPMITPFSSGQVKTLKPAKTGELVKAISSGNSSYGYDVTLGRSFKVFTNLKSAIIDPKRFDDDCLVDATRHCDPNGEEYVILPPNSYLLGHTIETFNIPRNVQVVCLGKSTYARAGAIINVTPIEAEFKGQVVIEISNSTTLPMKIYANEGISQFLFFESDEECLTSYKDRAGKYMRQEGVVVPRMK